MLRSIALMSVFCFMIPWVFRRPWLGVLICAWLGYMAPQRLTYGFAYTFPFSAVAVGVTLFSWFISRETTRFPFTRETLLQIAFCFWITFTTFFAFNDRAWDVWMLAIKVQVTILMTLLIIQKELQLKALVWTIVASIGFYGWKGGLWTLLSGGSDHVLGPADSFIEDNNMIALALVMTLPLVRYLQLQAKGKWLRYGLAAAQVLQTVAILGTYSRGGFLALCVVGLLLLWKSRHKLVLALAMLLVIPPAIVFMPDKWTARMQTIGATDEKDLDGSVRTRLDMWKFAVELAEDRPVLGGGFKAVLSPIAIQYLGQRSRHEVHSIYFGVLSEHGFPGLAIFLSLGLCTWLTARRVVRQARHLPELQWASDLVRMAQVSLAGYAVGGTFVSLVYFDLPYHLMAIVVICSVIVRQTRLTVSNVMTIEEASAVGSS